MAAVEHLAPDVGLQQACRALGVARASFYRSRQPVPTEPASVRPRPKPPLALTEPERQHVLDVLHDERFVDSAPSQVYATLLDEGIYLCSERTMYRILEQEGEVRERRDQLRHPAYQKPELLATGPNQVWSWDITKLLGPTKWSSYCLYVILDVFSRYIVGWMVAERETAALAERLISETVQKEQIGRDQLTLHADRGSSMTSKPVALLLADLGITKSHSRPHTSNDNPFSEAQFKTLKYHPSFPQRFDSLQHARTFCRQFFLWYNTEHRHGSLGLLTPETVHRGLDQQVLSRRSEVLQAAFARHPERFKGRLPIPKTPPANVYINPPKPTTQEELP
jgi:putative transposase